MLLVVVGRQGDGGCRRRTTRWRLGQRRLAAGDTEAFVCWWSWLVKMDLRGDWPTGEIEEGKEVQVGGLATGSGGDPEVGDDKVECGGGEEDP